MSFSSTAKEALLHKHVKTDREYGIVLCAATSSIGTLTLRRGRGIGIRYVTESLPVAKFLSRAAQSAFSVSEQLELHDSSTLGSKSVELILYGEDAEYILKLSHLLSDDTIKPVVPESRAEYLLYLRGAFLACGTVTDPNKSYHLELTCRNELAARLCIEYAQKAGIAMKYAKRKEFHIAYIKDSDGISEFLSCIGADAAYLELESTRILKDTRNYANRTRNCDVANIDRAGTAARHQVAEIDYLLRVSKDKLPDTLFETAKARLANPDATLTELSEILGLGKSGVNHRLQRLLKLANELHVSEKK